MPDGLTDADVSIGLTEAVTGEAVFHESIEAVQSLAEPGVAGPSAGQDVPAGTPPGSEKSGGFFAPLRLANFRRLIAGQTISRLGDQFYFVALPWLVLRVVDSSHAAASLALVSGVSAAMLGVFTLAGGVLADRYGPRALMLGSDVARFLTIAVLAALALLSTPPLWVLILLSALLGIAGGLFYPASMAMVPHLVAGKDLQAANSFDQLTMQSSNFIGPGVAGVVLGVTRLALGFVVDAVSFLISVVSLALIRMPRQAHAAPEAATAPKRKAGSGLRDLGEAFRFLRGSRFLFTLLCVSFVCNLAVNGLFEVALPLLLKQWVGIANGPRALGFVVGGFGLGAVIGAVAAGVASKLRRKSLVALLTLLPMAALLAAAPFLGGIVPLAGAFAVAGLLNTVTNVLIFTVIQRLIPMEMMGRMMSVVLLGSFIGTPISIAAYGVAASLVPNVAWLFIAGGAMFAVAALGAMSQKVFWQAE